MSLIVLQTLLRELEEGRSAVLISVTGFRGSVPRKDFPRLAVLADGRQIGTIGGGRLDGLGLEMAARLQDRGGELADELVLDVETGQDAGLYCGGKVEIAGRCFTPVAEDMAVIRELLADPDLTPPRLLLFGGGNVALSAAVAAHAIGFGVSVIDDREDFASRQRFPFAESCLAGSVESASNLPPLSARDAVFIMTRSHDHDLEAMDWVCGCAAGYIGLLGSRRKRARILEMLAERGRPVAGLEGRFRSPVGVEVAAETPEEIGLAAAVELIAFRRGVLEFDRQD
ncbi:MAG: hypothetical protein GY835_13045 [bacterium]|nr:hypothetical protein [bacterium]